MKNPFAVVVVLLMFIFMLYARKILFKIPFYKKFWNSEKLKARWENFWWLEQLVRMVGLSWLGVFIIYRFGLIDTLKELGLLGSVWKGWTFAFFATFPMLIIPILTKMPAAKAKFEHLLFNGLIWPLAEEVAFRGFAFGLLYKNLSDQPWALWTAALLTGIIFGLVHLQQQSIEKLSLGNKIFTVAIIAFGGVLSAWLYAVWDFNLWIPIGVHGFMNLWWELFDHSGSAKGGWISNFTREFSILLTILLTIFRDQLLPFL